MIRLKKGFTLIELLIVIAILGTLAVVIIVALNPLEQLRKTRDAGRISAVGQIGRAQEAYATSNGGVYISTTATGVNNWMGPSTTVGSLAASGEISVVPSLIAYAGTVSACTTNVQNGLCYVPTAAAGTGPIVVYARLEALANYSRCAAATPNAYVVYSSADGRGGTVCRAAGAEPVPGNQTFLP